MKESKKIMDKCNSGLEFIFGPVNIGGQHKGFTIFETDDMDKITKYVTHYSPLVNFNVYPLERDSKFFDKYIEKFSSRVQLNLRLSMFILTLLVHLMGGIFYQKARAELGSNTNALIVVSYVFFV